MALPTLGQVLRKRRKELGFTQDRVSEAAGISKPYLSNIETNKVKNPPSDEVLSALEKALGLETASLRGLAHLARTPKDIRAEHEALVEENQKLRTAIKQIELLKEGKPLTDDEGAIIQMENIATLTKGAMIPVINKVAAGYPVHFTDLDYPPSIADEYVQCPDVRDKQAFAARVVGDSMEPSYHQGDIVVFSPGVGPRTGDDCFIRFVGEGGTTFKRFYQDTEMTVRLQPLNSRYPAKVYPVEKINGVWPAVYRVEKLR